MQILLIYYSLELIEFFFSSSKFKEQKKKKKLSDINNRVQIIIFCKCKKHFSNRNCLTFWYTQR